MQSLQPSPEAVPRSPQVEAALELQRRRSARTGLLPFTQYTYARYQAGYPHRIIAEACDRVIDGGVDRLMIMAPPRHGKTELATRRLPAYALGRRPDWQIISAAATQPLADGNGRDVRNIIASAEYQRLFATRLASDSRAKGEWSTDAGGSFYSAGVGSAIMGKGGNTVIIDDPFSSWADAQSEISRRDVWEWYTSTIYNRLADKESRIIVINHRMHEDDLCGHLMEQEAKGGDKWERVTLDAINGGLALWPERFDIDALERIRVMMSQTNPMAWFALYMQKPTAPDGIEFKRDQFRYYNEVPRDLNVYIAGDFAVTEDTKADFTEFGVFGICPLGNVYALDWWSGQVQTNVWVSKLVSMFQQWQLRNLLKFVGEKGVIRRAVEPYLTKEMEERKAWVSMEWVNRSADKTAMAVPFQALVQNGRFYVPRTEWAEALIDQLLKFPTGRKDDKVDACANLGLHLAQVWAAAPTREPEPVRFDAPLRAADVFQHRPAARW